MNASPGAKFRQRLPGPHHDRRTLSPVRCFTGTHSEAVKTGVTVGTQLASELPPIQCDRVQLQQVMLNLIVNGIQSMSDVEDGDRELHISTLSVEPEGVCVAVRDTGHGLRPESQPRLVEPFYTTKAGGMGMGLSICRSIIDAHGGRLWATRWSRGVLSFGLRSRPLFRRF
jgi:signal transduction histidine kinase